MTQRMFDMKFVVLLVLACSAACPLGMGGTITNANPEALAAAGERTVLRL
jgi:hypothetical protein